MAFAQYFLLSDLCTFLPGLSNVAPGISHHLGGSGASHAGLGGRGGCGGSKTCRTLKNTPYGSIYHPRSFGSGGAGSLGGIGKISLIVMFCI